MQSCRNLGTPKPGGSFITDGSNNNNTTWRWMQAVVVVVVAVVVVVVVVCLFPAQSYKHYKNKTWYITTSNYAGGHQKSQWLIVLAAVILVINVVLQPVRATVRARISCGLWETWLTFRELSLWDICISEQMIHCNLFSHIHIHI